MSTFGEIVEPSTRTAWEDWDETIQENSHSKLFWQKDLEVPSAIHSLLILEGRPLLDSIGSLTQYNFELVNVIREVDVKLYRTNCFNIYVCILRDYNLLLASEIVELLKPFIIVSNEVIAMLTKPLVEYQTTEYMSKEYVMRSLNTTKPLPMSFAKNIPKLEQPNIISGVAAGVVSLREIMNQSGAAIVCYMEHNEEYQIKELQELLNKLNFGPVQPQANTILNSNLYI